jgi:uncharacterized protein involved in tellurium resistance
MYSYVINSEDSFHLKMNYVHIKHSVFVLFCSVIYEGVSKSFRTESITKYTLTTINTHCEATQRVMAAKVAMLTHKIAIQLYLMAESCTICISRYRRPVRKIWIQPRMCIS